MDVQVGVPPPPPPPPPPPAFFAETSVPSPPPTTQPTTTAPTTTANVTSPPTQDRIWLHPWTVNEMRDHASQWSLAGDTGVLLYLEQFSDRLTQRADAIQQHINQTVNAVKSTHTRVLNCLNEFTSLANTQFIENRVYDEDETANSTAESTKKDEQSTDKSNANNTEAQEKVLQRYVEAIQYGLAILDTHFERIEPKSDKQTNGRSSFVEEDEDTNGLQEPILETKDPYILRPLPYLIGGADFMQDDYVGLRDLSTESVEPEINAIPVENLPSDDSDLSSLEDGEDEDNFQAVVQPVASIVPAGAPRPDLSQPQQQSKPLLSDSDDNEDDPFGIGKVTKIDSGPSKPANNDDDLFDDEPRKPQPKSEKPFTLDTDDEDNSSVGLPTKPPQPTMNRVRDDDDFNDSSSTESDKSEEPEPEKPKMLSELERRVLKRRQELDDPDAPAGDNDGDNDDFGIKPAATKPKPSSNKPSSSTISNLTSQPLTAPPKPSQTSIFGEDDDDDDNDIFNPKSKLPSVLPPVQKVDIKLPQKKEKDMFDDDDSDDDTDIFSPKMKKPTAAVKKPDPTPTQPIGLSKPKDIVLVDVNEDDDFFETKTTSVIPTPAANKKDESSQSSGDDDDDTFNTPVKKTLLPPVSKAPPANVSDGEGPLPIVKPPETKPTPPPVVLPTAKKPNTKLDDSDSSDDTMFGIPKNPPSSTTKATPPTTKAPPAKADDSDGDLFDKSKPTTTKTNLLLPNPSKSKRIVSSGDDDSDGDLFDRSKPTTTKTNLLLPNPSKSKRIVSSGDDDDDGGLFSSKPSSTKPPAAVVSLPVASSVKSNFLPDPLGLVTSTESTSSPSPPVAQQTKPSSTSTRKSISGENEEESPTAKQELNPDAVGDDEITDVKKLVARMKINPGLLKPPGGFKPPMRPKASSITEEPPKPSAEDDDQPIENKPPARTVPKKITPLDPDSDEDDLFGSTTKKETPKTPVVEQKEKPTDTNENGKNSIKNRAAGLNFAPMMPGALPKPIPKETNNEPVIDKTMNDMLRDKAKAGPRRAPPSKRGRPIATASSAAAAASIDDDDDLFATPKSTTTTTKSPSTPTVAPIASVSSPAATPVEPPSSITVPVVTAPSAPAPVTGLIDKPAAIAAKQTKLKEKKKFSLFNSDDSDIDELLFGSSTKKNKSSVTPKATTTTTTKPASKTSALPLDDDDDFLSKRPQKKSTKPVVDGDDIFADVKSKGQPENKAKKDWSILNKSDGKDDIFNDIPTKSSSAAKPKPTNGKTKPAKNFDDLFGDPLNPSSK